MVDARYFTKLYLQPLSDIMTYLETPDWTDDVTKTTLSPDETDSFTLDLKADHIQNIYNTSDEVIEESNYETTIEGNDVEITNVSDSDFTVSYIEYAYNTDFSEPAFGAVNWSRIEPPLLMIQPDIFSIEGGDTSINRVRFNFIYERSYTFTDFENNADDIFTLMGLILAKFHEMSYDIGDVDIGEIEAYQGEIEGNYLESLSIEIIYTAFIDWDEFFEK